MRLEVGGKTNIAIHRQALRLLLGQSGHDKGLHGQVQECLDRAENALAGVEPIDDATAAGVSQAVAADEQVSADKPSAEPAEPLVEQPAEPVEPLVEQLRDIQEKGRANRKGKKGKK